VNNLFWRMARRFSLLVLVPHSQDVAGLLIAQAAGNAPLVSSLLPCDDCFVNIVPEIPKQTLEGDSEVIETSRLVQVTIWSETDSPLALKDTTQRREKYRRSKNLTHRRPSNIIFPDERRVRGTTTKRLIIDRRARTRDTMGFVQVVEPGVLIIRANQLLIHNWFR
jgi:hypothetical protein